MRATIYIGVVALAFCYGSESSVPQTRKNTVQLMISLQNQNASGPPAFVFVKGQLSGVVPGVVFLSADESVPIEIGLAQFKFSPLYSFEFGPDVIKRGTITVVATNYNLDRNKCIVIVKPNTIKTLTLNKLTGNYYSVRLPIFDGDSSGSFKEFWAKVQDKGINSINHAGANIPVDFSDDYTRSALHLSYNAHIESNKTVLLKNPADWSGARYVGFSGGLFDPFYADTEKWTIVSTPEGATIFTAEGDRGKTNSTVSITKSLSSYVVLQLDGYQQCAQTECVRSEPSPGEITLKCDLKKSP
jgi:hypothetical protein